MIKNKDGFVFKYGSIYNENIDQGARHLKKQSVLVDLIVAEPVMKKSLACKQDTVFISSASFLLKKGGSFLVFSPVELIGQTFQTAKKAKLLYKNMLVFEDLSKSPNGQSKKFFTSTTVAILWFIKPGAKVYFSSQNLPYVSPVIKASFDKDFDKYDERVVNNQKPIKVYNRLLNFFSQQNETVLFTHAAGGSGVISALSMKRNWLAFVNNSDIFTKTKDRIDKFKNSNN
ncbi:MAG: site-specific DNA-methyltransferase [Bifidobacteriaceae bacterium]|jgi:DNA modification methylase|nr:site-specific DNA-methyltransferase [Bifidobacteriaceae bacterium]